MLVVHNIEKHLNDWLGTSDSNTVFRIILDTTTDDAYVFTFRCGKHPNIKNIVVMVHRQMYSSVTAHQSKGCWVEMMIDFRSIYNGYMDIKYMKTVDEFTNYLTNIVEKELNRIS